MQLLKTTFRHLDWLRNYQYTNPNINQNDTTIVIANQPNCGYLGVKSDGIDDIVFAILSRCRVTDAVNLGQVSKYYKTLCNHESLWKLFCCRVQPDIQKVNEKTWKQTYIEDIDLRKFLGGMQIVQIYPSCDVQEINVNTNADDFKGIDFKKLIKSQLKEPCSLQTMSLFYNRIEIKNDDLIKPLNINNSEQLDVYLIEDEIMFLSGRDIALNPQK